MSNYTLCVTGYRNFNDSKVLNNILDQVVVKHGLPSLLVAGDAKGADNLAINWAITRNIKTEKCIADWNKYGKGAGPLRNKYMLETYKPTVIVGFLSEKSLGTKDCLNQAKIMFDRKENSIQFIYTIPI